MQADTDASQFLQGMPHHTDKQCAKHRRLCLHVFSSDIGFKLKLSC